MSLRLLGRFALSDASARVIALPSKKAQALLACLALSPTGRRSRAEIATLLWSDRGEEQARHSLRQCVLTIRKAWDDEAGALLVSDNGDLALGDGAFAVDVHEFEHLVAQRGPEALAAAIKLYSGDFLDGLYVRSEGFDEWVAQERLRLRNVATDALALLAEWKTESRDFEDAIVAAERLLRLDPLREDGHRALMRLYDRTGRRSAALRQFRTCQDVLRRELDTEPEAESVALYEDLRGRTPSGPSGGTTNRASKPNSKINSPAVSLDPELSGAVRARRWKPGIWAALGTVAVLAVAAAVYWGVYPRGTTPSFAVARHQEMAFPLPDKPSIAVLPFENRTGDPEQGNFVYGITEGVTTALSIVSEMFVIAPPSALTYGGRPVEVQTVAEELGVRYVLMGSVQRADERIRISAQLVDAVGGNQVWAERYDRELQDIFELQDEITLKIITALQVEITEGEQERISLVHGTNDLEAWMLAGQGLQLIRHLTKEDNSKARALYHRAIERDPNYPGAWDGLAWTHVIDARFGWSESRANSLSRAAELSQKTLSLDDTRPRSYGLLGQVALAQADHDGALVLGEKALALNPNGADVAALLGLSLTYTGDAERAASVLRHAMRLSPYYPDWYRWSLGRSYRLSGRYDEAVAALSAGLGRQPEALAPRVELVATYSQMGQLQLASKMATEILQISPQFSARAWTQNPRHADVDTVLEEYRALRRAGLPE